MIKILNLTCIAATTKIRRHLRRKSKRRYFGSGGKRLIVSGRGAWPLRRSASTLAAVFSLCLSVPGLCGEVWLGGKPAMPDYLDVFEESAPWTDAAASIRVFKVSTQFLGGASDETLRRVFSELERRHIALAWEALMLVATQVCGDGIEGYASTSTVDTIVQRVARLGGDLRYVAMDEPLWFGHFSTLANACHMPVDDIAGAVAKQVAIIKHGFPDAQVGDIEGVGIRTPPHWTDELMHWADAYRGAAGVPLAFLQADVQWDGPWRDQLTDLRARLLKQSIKFGIIYNGDVDDQTGLAWTRHTEQRFAEIEAAPALIPDQAVLQTWMAHPTHMLPETQPGTMTWLVNRYVAAETHLAVHRVGERLEGRLTDSAGRSLPGAKVAVVAARTGESGTATLHQRSGKVPDKVVAALFALRINAECNCSGPADIQLGPLSYHDDRTGQRIEQALQPRPERGPSPVLTQFRANSGQALIKNTTRFPVSASDPFTVEASMRTDLASARSGYVALIFLDGNGKEVERLRMPFQPAEQLIGTATTDAQGSFSMSPNPKVLRAGMGIRAEFAGDANRRSTSAQVP
jgi:hypothetical protein